MFDQYLKFALSSLPDLGRSRSHDIDTNEWDGLYGHGHNKSETGRIKAKQKRRAKRKMATKSKRKNRR